LQEHPRGVGAAGAGERERSSADGGGQQATELTLAVANPACQAGDALAVDDTVGDETHRASGDIGAAVPPR
jgi:hypothetical protein